MTTAAIDPTKTPDEIVEDIEAAEESKDISRVVAFLGLASSNEHGGEEDWAEVAEAALDALYRLVKGGAVAVDVAGTVDGDIAVAGSSTDYLRAVFDALNAWEEEEAIVEVGLGCIVAIASKADPQESASNDKDGDAGIMAEISVEFVLDLMKDFGAEATIQEQACLAMEGLALWKDSWKNVLAGAEGVRDELLAARDERITNERNKSYPVRAAKALGIDLE
jgi:hypothetical protein